MTETEGLIPRPADVIGNLDYEINRGGNSATINAMIAARDALLAQQNGNTPPPVTAWAVVDKSEAVILSAISEIKSSMEVCAEYFNRMFEDRAPHRVIEVTITPKEKG